MMAIPNATGLTTENLDQAADNPSKARPDLSLLMQKVRELLESVDQVGGIVKLDADAQIEIAKLFKAGSGLSLVKKTGTGNVLAHTNKPETVLDVSANKGEAIKRIKIDDSGHVLRVESGDVTTLTGPFYSKWYFSRHEVISQTSVGIRKPSNFNSDILSWIPGLDAHIPSISDYLKTLKSSNILSSIEEEGLNNIENTFYQSIEEALPLTQRTQTRYFKTTIKPFRARYLYYTIT